MLGFRPEPRDRSEGLDVDFHQIDVLEPDTLPAACSGADAVIHVVALISITGDPTGMVHRVNVEGARNSATAALESGSAGENYLLSGTWISMKALGQLVAQVTGHPAQVGAVVDRIGSRRTERLLALPGFDEYLLGFKDRAVPVPAGMMNRIIPGHNGVFQATVVRDGRVIATWKRRVTKTQVRIDLFPFEELSEARLRRTRTAFDRYANFLGVEADVRLHQ